LDTGRIFLLTDYGKRYIVPRFSFNPTGDSARFFSRYDAIDIKSFITFRIASTGVLGETENDIVLKFPNGGENLEAESADTIRWETYGAISNVDVYYGIGSNPIDWIMINIEEGIVNNDWFEWKPIRIAGPEGVYSDSVRIRIKDSNSELYDVSGWYFSVTEGGTSRIATDNGILNNTRIKRPGKSH